MTQSLKDMTGKKFGKLLVINKVIKHNRSYWTCQCECGNIKNIRADQILHKKDCGCVPKKSHSASIYEIGNRYGKLVVIRQAKKIYGSGNFWECQCDCGNIVIVSGGNLRFGKHKSCSCGYKLPKGEAAFNRTYRNMMIGAIKRKHVWEITKEQAKQLMSQPCFYCGKYPFQISNQRQGNGNFIYNGFDRVDNAQGYVISNLVACCGKCNRAKYKFSVDEFKAWVKDIYTHWLGSPDLENQK